MISIKNFVINLHPVIGSSDLWMPLHHKSLVILISPSLIAIAFLFFMSVQAATNPQDVNVLISLHSAWSQKPSSWDTSTDPCEDAWLGIRCDATNTRVTQLLLINQDLAGTLPSAIANLTDLTDLDLSSNPKLGGSLPKEIGNLKNLTRFYVQFCNFSGSIPSDIGNLTLLQHLGMTQNAFSGTLPDTIGLLKNLNWFDISSNQLSGFLPDSTTSASGSGLDSLTNAQHFHLENNSFSGSIPSSIFNSQMRLLHLLLHSNNLTGIIPTNIGDMPHVEIIRMDSNFLTGSVPSNLSIIQNLTTLQLNNNNLSGQLPDLSNNTNLQMLYLGNNQFDTAAIPSWISKLQKLYLLSMDSANLTGSIPADIFYSSTNISNVTLASNNLNGTLNLTLATSNLLIVNVTNNNLTALDNSNYTLELLLDGNPYCNSNPTECSTLQAGTSPPPPSSTNASECSNVCQAQYAINTKASTGCQCARPVVGNVAFLATKIPLLVDYGISNVENLIASGLNTSSFLESLTFLDTQVVVDVISATQINVSVFPPSTTDAWSPSNAARISYVLKNQEIQFPGIGPIVCGFTGTPYDTVIVVNKLSTAAKIGIGIGVAVFVSAIVVLGVFAMQQRKRAQKAEKLNKPFASWIAGSDGQTADIPQLKGARWFSLDEIRKCTNNFSQNNEIGEGGYGKVYKGYLSSGERVAIKRAGAHSLQGATEFKNEIELLSRVHHRNLVGLIGFCFEEGEQMLVYEYMPNGTLRECLSGTTGIQMDWERRIALALHSARGIAYLHTEANPPIIHRDIKSTNILLDEKLVAKVADFGLSKLAPTEGAVNPVSTEVKGTLGYLDPDYFMTNRLTDKSDVYSFGVVLLEVVTARLPLRGTKYVVREVRTALAQGGMGSVVKSMVDPDLREYPPKALERLVELALACVEENPDARPTMAEVVKEIESLSEGPSVKMDERLGEKDGQVYEEELPFMKPKLGTPFEYSGSFVGMSTTMEPK